MKKKMTFQARTMGLLVTVLLAAGLFSSCGGELVHHTADDPFIIESIEASDGVWRYSRSKWRRVRADFFSTTKQCVTTDQDLGYRVGDTLQFLPCR
jgi:hypothetical protein